MYKGGPQVVGTVHATSSKPNADKNRFRPVENSADFSREHLQTLPAEDVPDASAVDNSNHDSAPITLGTAREHAQQALSVDDPDRAHSDRTATSRQNDQQL